MKKILLPALLVAAAMSSCSKNEVTDVMPQSDNANAIGLNIVSSVSRGIPTTTETLNTNATKVNISYYEATDAAKGGVLNFVTNGQVWSQTVQETVKWSALLGDDTQGDLKLYSMSTGTGADAPVDLDVAANGATATATFAQVTGTNISNHQDLVYYAGNIQSVPSSSNITAVFDHALSRIELYADMGSMSANKTYVKYAVLHNMVQSGDATITNDGATIAWEPTAGVAKAPRYDFIQTTSTYSAPQVIADKKLIMQDPKNEYASSNSSNAIVIPQTIAESASTLTANSGYDNLNSLNSMTETAVVSLYRMDKSNDEAFVGYPTIEDCIISAEKLQAMVDANEVPDEDIFEMNEDADGNKYYSFKADYVTSDMKDGNDDKGLYVLVAFPFSDDLELLPNYDYDFLLGYGTNGGVLLSKYYFTAKGINTKIPIDDRKPGDEVLPDPDGAVGLKVLGNGWQNGGDYLVDGDEANKGAQLSPEVIAD